MSLTALEIEKGAEKLQESFDKEILKLNKVKSKLLEDKNVQLFVFFNSRIQEEKLKKENAINEFINTNREECEHPLYVCVTSMNSSYSYKCICLNCGKTAYFKEYELNSLYNEHKLIALKKEESFLPMVRYEEAKEYYLNQIKQIQTICHKLNKSNDDIIDIVSEATYDNFVLTNECVKKPKVLKK